MSCPQGDTNNAKLKLERFPAVDRYVKDLYMEFDAQAAIPDDQLATLRAAIDAKSPIAILDHMRKNIRDLLGQQEEEQVLSASFHMH